MTDCCIMSRDECLRYAYKYDIDDEIKFTKQKSR